MQDVSGRVKGMIFVGTKKWILEKFGEDGFQLFIQKLPEIERKDWSEMNFLPSSLVSASYYKHMYEALTSLWGAEDPLIFQKGAGAVAFYDLNRIFKVIMRVSTPSFIASRFPLVWKQYHTSGSYTITKTDPCGFEAEITDIDIYGIAGCEGALGWSKHALIYTGGAKNLEAIHYECKFRGGKSCKIRYKWQ